jgi:uncharacterized protein (DUF736 family)
MDDDIIDEGGNIELERKTDNVCPIGIDDCSFLKMKTEDIVNICITCPLRKDRFRQATENLSARVNERNNDMERVGALWQNTTSGGRPYFNMDVEGQKYIIFANLQKTEEQQPDFIVYQRIRG